MLALGMALLLPACQHQMAGLPPAVSAISEEFAPAPATTAPEAETPTRESEISTLIDTLTRVSEHGLNPEVYGVSDIGSLDNDPEAQLAAAEQAWVLAATHLAHGYLDPETLLPRPAGPQEQVMLAQLESGGPQALADALSRMAPQHPAYLFLRKELERQRTALEQEADPEKQAAGQTKIDKLRVNLERWRWLPHDLGARSVMANIAGFDVTTFEHDTPTSRHTAIFGKTQRQTPNFSDEIEYIIFNPWWEVPESIARQDKLPQFRRDPGVIQRLGYQILDRQGNVVDPSTIDWNSAKAASFPYRIRQAPGPQNALGQVKIMFPNPHNVYLHDTPEKDLFESDQRTFSSGCIRVHDPLDLAAWVLRDTAGWDRAKIEVTVASGTETRVDLSEPVPVYVVYLTATSDACGDVTYLDDVYDRDGSILAALQGEPQE